MNKVILIGNLTRNPSLNETSNGDHACIFSIAVSRNYISNDGTRETDFFNIITYQTQAENCHKYLKKGNKVAIVGRLQNRSYKDVDGRKKTVTDIIASEVEFLPSKKPTDSEESLKPQPESTSSVDNDDLPF